MSKWSDYFYNRLPKIYRDFDKDTQLKRFLEVLVEEGFEKQLIETLNLEQLVNADTCPSEYFPYLCETYGIKYFEDIPEIYQRKFLKNIVSLYMRKGTKTAIEFLARELSGYSAEIVPSTEAGEYLVRLNAYENVTPEFQVAQDAIARYLDQFIPISIVATIATSYGFIEDFEFTHIIEPDFVNIVDETMENLIDWVLEEEFVNITNDLYEDINILIAEKTSLTNVAKLGTTFYTNIINGIDKITVDSITTIKIY